MHSPPKGFLTSQEEVYEIALVSSFVDLFTFVYFCLGGDPKRKQGVS